MAFGARREGEREIERERELGVKRMVCLERSEREGEPG